MFIYAIRNAAGQTKVGKANNPDSRLASLQTASSTRLRISMIAPTAQPDNDERAVHAILTNFKLCGEWFSADVDTVESAFLKCGLAPVRRVSPAFAYLKDRDGMSPECFSRWLSTMSADPYLCSDAECARLLGLSANSIVSMKRKGTDKRTALACRALLHRLEPYG